jgi:signal transduction histidine kinase
LAKRTAVNYSTSFSSKAFPLKRHLVLLTVGTLLPIIIFAAIVVYRLSWEEQQRAHRRLLQESRSLALAAGREVDTTVRTLQALAESEWLDHGDLKSFYLQSRRTLKTQSSWLTVILLAPGGQQLLNTNYPFGAHLPLANENESLRQLVENRRPTIGNAAQGKVRRRWAFPVRVPVMRAGKLRYVLTAVITPQALAKSIRSEAGVEGEWTRSIVDGNGVIVMRTRNPDKFIGSHGSASFLKRIGQDKEAIYTDRTLEGVPVYIAFSRIPGWSWTAAVAVPRPVLEAPGRRALLLVCGLGALLLLASAGGAAFLSARISRAMTSAATAAQDLTRDKQPVIAHHGIVEIEVLGQSLHSTYELLAHRERERDEHLQRTEAARAEAEAANRLKDEFLSILSHELRTPLTAILGWANVLQAWHRLDDETRVAALQSIESNAGTLNGMVDALLDMSKIIGGQLVVVMEPVDVAKVGARACDLLRHSASEKGVELSLHSVETAIITGDSHRLQQVVSNLVLNAIKFTPAGGRIDVELRQVDSNLQLIVRDTGVGISAESLPYVFEKFRQADSSNTRSFGGMGLGLAFVRHVVELHNGSVTASSDGEGTGAQFTVLLPLARGSNSASSA